MAVMQGSWRHETSPSPSDHGASRWATAYLPYLLLCIVCCRGEAIIPRLQQGSAIKHRMHGAWVRRCRGRWWSEQQAVHTCAPRQLSCMQAEMQLTHLDLTDDQQGVGAVARKHVIDVQVIPSKPGTGAVPP